MPRDLRQENRSAAWGSLAFCLPEGAPEKDESLVVIEDVGARGLFIATDDPPALGTVLRLQLYSQAGPPGGSTAQARAIVRWRRLSGGPIGVGVQIMEAEEGGSSGLESWLNSLAAAPRYRSRGTVAAAPFSS
jgi:hypothetical protein